MAVKVSLGGSLHPLHILMPYVPNCACSHPLHPLMQPSQNALFLINFNGFTYNLQYRHYYFKTIKTRSSNPVSTETAYGVATLCLH